MQSFLKGTVAVCLTLGLFATCTVLLPDGWGSLNWPCDSDVDCSGGFNCDWNTVGVGFCVPDDMPTCTTDYECFGDLNLPSAFCNGSTCLPFDNDGRNGNDGFGDRCGPGRPCIQESYASQCVCFFDEENCFCTHECSPTLDQCNDLSQSAVCMATGLQNSATYACARLGFTQGTGAECGGEDDCTTETDCVNFQNVSHGICSQPCPQGSSCPWNLECREVAGNNVCAFCDWLGFYHDCGSEDDCSTFPDYNECPDGHCTRICDYDEECPDGAYCHLSGYCDLLE